MGRKKVGRPKVEIEKEQFEKLCAIGCTILEIAGWFNCSDDTILNYCHDTYGKSFADVFAIYSAKAKISLRRNQLRLSETNPTMAIWLGKQMLGQTDKIESVNTEKIEVINDIPSLDK